MPTSPEPSPRATLTRERLFRAGVELADGEGMAAVTMRRLAQAVGVEAMSLYHHVSGKGPLVDAMADLVVDELNAAVATLTPTGDWAADLRARVLRARAVMLAHPWVPAALEGRTSALSPGLVIYHDGVLAILLRGGFSYDLAHHALHALGSRAMGFSQELFTPGTGEGIDPASLSQLITAAPHIAAMLAEVAHDHPETTLGWCDDQSEFEFGIDVFLAGLTARLRAESGTRGGAI